MSPEDRSSFDEDARVKLMKVFKDHAKGYRSSTGGWVEEELEHEGEKALVYTLLIAWDSVDLHLAFRNADEFKKNIHLLRGNKDGLGVDVVHCSFKETQPASNI